MIHMKVSATTLNEDVAVHENESRSDPSVFEDQILSIPSPPASEILITEISDGSDPKNSSTAVITPLEMLAPVSRRRYQIHSDKLNQPDNTALQVDEITGHMILSDDKSTPKMDRAFKDVFDESIATITIQESTNLEQSSSRSTGPKDSCRHKTRHRTLKSKITRGIKMFAASLLELFSNKKM